MSPASAADTAAESTNRCYLDLRHTPVCRNICLSKSVCYGMLSEDDWALIRPAFMLTLF